MALVAIADEPPPLQTAQLSGGMRKRVTMAQNWILDRDVVLMDEPFSALDVHTRQRMETELLSLWDTAAKKTVVFVTHDLEEALFMADRVVVMSSHPGRIARIVEVPFERPRSRDLKTFPEFQTMRRELGHVLDANRGLT